MVFFIHINKPNRVSRLSSNRNLYWLLLMLPILGLTSCARLTTKPAIDNSFFTEQPCAAPCWHNLELGKSNEQDVQNTISQLPFVAEGTIHVKELGPDAKWIGFDCTYKTAGNCGELVLSNNKLSSISIEPGHELTFKMVVDQLGTPDKVQYIGDLTNIMAGSHCVTALSWSKNNIISVTTSEKGDCPSGDLRVKPNLQVSDITYRLPSELDSYMYGIPWPGFLNP